jgi:hypothetical protein
VHWRKTALDSIHCIEDGSLDDSGRTEHIEGRHGWGLDQRFRQDSVPIGYFVCRADAAGDAACPGGKDRGSDGR